MAKNKPTTKELENALDNIILEKKEDKSLIPQSDQQPEASLSKEEETGFHKGAINTLLAERNELVKMIGNVEAIMQMHLKRLQELGVKIETRSSQEKK